MNMRIVTVTPGTFPVPSESSSSVERVVMQVAAQLGGQYPFHIFSKKTRAAKSRETIDGIGHIRLPAKRYLPGVSDWIGRLRPDVVQVENRPRMARYLRARHKRIPLVLSLHSTTFISEPHISGKELRSCLRAADRIIVNSGFLQEHLGSLAPEVRERTVVIYPGTDIDRFQSRWSEAGRDSRHALLKELGYEGKKIVLYAGRLQAIKGVHHALEALPEIIREHPNVVLVIVGSAYYGRNALTDYVKKLHRMGGKMPNHVRFIPFVPHDEMARWFQLADVMVVPSARREAFGLVNVEAMAAGIPVVATNAGGIREIVRHHRTGILVDPDNVPSELAQAVNRLLADRELAKRMGQLGSQFAASHFTWSHTADGYRRLFESIRISDSNG